MTRRPLRVLLAVGLTALLRRSSSSTASACRSRCFGPLDRRRSEARPDGSPRQSRPRLRGRAHAGEPALLLHRRAARHADRRAARHRRRSATIAMLLPITFALAPVASLIMLAGIYYGAQYGGSTTAILINLPGEASSAVTAIDGYQMARQGRAGAGARHRGASARSSPARSRRSLIALFAPPLADVALQFGPAEYFSLMVLGLVVVGRAGARLGAQGAGDDRARPAARPRRHRRLYRHAALHLRHSASSPTASTSSRSPSASSASPRSCAISRTSTTAQRHGQARSPA